MEQCTWSDLRKTWIFDLDGTLVVHNGYKMGQDILLPGVKEYMNNISTSDYVLILTARSSKYEDITKKFLKDNDIRYNKIIFDLPVGERIMFNDKKPDGLLTCHCFNLERNGGLIN